MVMRGYILDILKASHNSVINLLPRATLVYPSIKGSPGNAFLQLQYSLMCVIMKMNSEEWRLYCRNDSCDYHIS